jgi:hypothetical protein
MSTRERGVLRDAQADLYDEILAVMSDWTQALIPAEAARGDR